MGSGAAKDAFLFEGFHLDRSAGGLFRTSANGGLKPLALGARALDLLEFLIIRRGELVSKSEILANVWQGAAIEESNLSTQILALRRVLDEGRPPPSCIQTVAGRGYRFVVRVASAENRPLVPRLSIVVLPFTNLSPHRSHEYLADAVTDDLTADLSRIADSFVIARTTAFTYKGKAVDTRQIARELGVRYVLEGSVRCLRERVQVNVQLIDGESASHIWADRFGVEANDMAEAQSEIVGRLVRALNDELLRNVGHRIEQEQPTTPDAQDIVMRARALRVEASVADVRSRRAMLALLEQAIIRDPGSVEARIQATDILVSLLADALSSSIDEDEAQAEQLIGDALERAPHRSEVHQLMGQLRRVQGRWAESQVQLEIALALDPNNSRAMRQLGITLLTQGQPEAAVPHLERGMRLDVRDRYVFSSYSNLGRCYLFLGRIGEAIDLLRRARTLAPGIWYVHSNFGGALGLIGELAEAKNEIVEFIKLKPEVNSIERLRTLGEKRGFGHPRYLALQDKTIYAGLRAAGFPRR